MEDINFIINQIVKVVDDTPTGLPFQSNEHLLYLGEIHGMPGHCIVVKKNGKVIWGFHTDNFRNLTEDEK